MEEMLYECGIKNFNLIESALNVVLKPFQVYSVYLKRRKNRKIDGTLSCESFF